MFETVDHAAGSVSVSAYVARNAGSSQHGNIRRASVASSWVERSTPSPPPGFVYGWTNTPSGAVLILPAYANDSVWRPVGAALLKVTVVNSRSSRVSTFATGAPSKRTPLKRSSRLLKIIFAVGRRTWRTIDSLPVMVFATASGLSAIV